jgi:hypothetical protein
MGLPFGSKNVFDVLQEAQLTMPESQQATLFCLFTKTALP